MKPLNDLFTKTINYRTYQLKRFDVRYDATTVQRINRYRNKLYL